MTTLYALILAMLQVPTVASFDPTTPGSDQLRGFMETWCLDCHQGSRARSDLDLEVVLDRIDHGEVPASIQRIIERLRRRDMPPKGEPRPEEPAFQGAVHALQGLLDAPVTGGPARTTIRRLGRYEYANTIRDLLGVELHIERELPADEIADGFDNNGDVLSVPPLLLEKYFDAAELVVDERPGEFVVIAGDVDDPGALARLAQNLLNHVVVGLRPVPRAF